MCGQDRDQFDFATVELIREGVDEYSYEVYLGKPFEEIITEWLTYYEQLTPEMSMEELECAYADMYGIALRQNETQKGDKRMRIAVAYENGIIFQHVGHREVKSC